MKANFFMPTRVTAGGNCLRENAALLKDLGRKALVVTGRASAKACGALDDALAALEANGQESALFDRALPNPTIDAAFEAAEAARRAGCDFVLAIGGGSPMDLGKAAAALAVNPLPRASFFTTPVARALPVAAVPTTAGTGSEVTQYAILTNDAAETKTSLASPLLFPRLAFLDARYLAGLPQAVTVNTALDALSHSVEGLLATRASPLIEGMAASGIRAFAECFDALKSGVVDAATREKLLLASTLGGMVIANTGTIIVHALGYSLTYFKHVDHGRANGLLLGAYLRFVCRKNSALAAKIFAAAGMTGVDEFCAALDALLGPRERLTAAEIEAYAEKAFHARHMTLCAVRPEKADLVETLRASVG